MGEVGINLGIELDIAGRWAEALDEYRQALEQAERLGSLRQQVRAFGTAEVDWAATVPLQDLAASVVVVPAPMLFQQRKQRRQHGAAKRVVRLRHHQASAGRAVEVAYAKRLAGPNPRLARVQDPFGNLLAKAKGSVLVSHAQVVEAEVST